MIHLDTCFLVDLLREVGRDSHGSAFALLARIQNEELGISVFVACELAAGAAMSKKSLQEKQRVDELCATLRVDYPDERFPGAYGSLLGSIERSGGRVATMDLLIATSALLAGASLVTRNEKDFARIPGLRIQGYGSAASDRAVR